jgi:hypothetical protein
MEAFTRDVELNENIVILTRLPIATYWTTNYDKLIEQGLEESKRKPDVKYRQSQLAISVNDRDAIVYKMHGDISDPSEAVLVKDDYERYNQGRSMFRTILQGELISKTFLFIGFSFEDPNLEFILGKVHSQVRENAREHYCFFKKVSPTEGDYEYKMHKQELRIHDLSKRYDIETILLDSWDEIAQILKQIEKNVKQKIKQRNIFISGSAAEYTESWTKSKIEELAYTLAQKLVKNNYRITTGFGSDIGSAVINGALKEIHKTKYGHVNEYLCLRPFPQNISDSQDRQNLYRTYREEMIGDVGASIFISGNKNTCKSIENSPGCLEEFEISKKNECIIIPIGSTGYTAKYILDEVKSSIADYSYLMDKLNILENSEDVDELANTVVRILEKQHH